MVRERRRTEEGRRFEWLSFESWPLNRPHLPSGSSEHHHGPGSDTVGFLGRLALVGVSAFLFATGFKISGAQSTALGWVLVEMLLYAGAIGYLVGAVLARKGWGKVSQAAVAIGLGVALVCSVSYEILVLHPSYGTDVLAFADGGAEMLLSGENPYQATEADVERIATQFGIERTLTDSGQPIDWLISYPALHVLTFTFFAGVEVADLRWAVLLIELVTLGVLWRHLSPRARLIAPIVILLEPYLSAVFTGGGVTDWLWVLPVVGTVISLQKRNFALAGLFLGLACAVKQHPWFAVPFVLIWVIQTLRHDARSGAAVHIGREVGVFAGALSAGFIVPNLPFIVWSPGSWFEAVFSPAMGSLSADGHGLALLSARGLLEFPSEIQLALMATAAAVLCFLFAMYFDRAQDLLWLMPLILVFLSHRALHSYFVFWLPIVVLWLDFRRRQVAY